MSIGAGRLTVVFIVALWLPCHEARGQTISASPGIVVYLEDHANVPAYVLQPALRQVTRTFLHVGIPVSWRTPPARPTMPMRRFWEYTVVMLSPEMVIRKCAAEGVGDEVAATAAPTVGRAWIFARRIVSGSDRRAMPAADMLGKVLTHEIGHLLLGRSPFEPVSVMQERLSFTVGGYGFTRHQGEQMRRALRAAEAPALAAAVLTPD
jgi:hypothetical protein